MQSPHQQFEQKPDSPEQQKSHGIKRRFSDVEGGQVKCCLQIYTYQIKMCGGNHMVFLQISK